MFRKKVYQSCPRCFSLINPNRVYKTVGICEHCTWAGSYQSEKYMGWVHFKVTMVIIFTGMMMTFGVAKLGKASNYQINPNVSKVFTQTIEMTQSLITSTRDQ